MNDSKRAEPDSGYPRLEGQIEWYDQKSGEAQKRYKVSKGAELICTAAVPVVAHYEPVVTTVLGCAVLVLEGTQLCQWHHNWITYRSTCESLRHEKYAYLGRSGPYDGLDEETAKRTLVERVEAHISTEHARWVAKQIEAARRTEKPN